MSKTIKLAEAIVLFAAAVPLSGHCWIDDRTKAITLTAPYVLEECSKRIPSTMPQLKLEYESWLSKQSAEAKEYAKSIVAESKAKTATIDGAFYRDSLQRQSVEDLAIACDAFRDLLEDKPEQEKPKSPDPVLFWESFANAMQNGDAKSARSMLMGKAREKFDLLHARGSNIALTKWANRVDKVSVGDRYGDFQELYVSTKDKQVFVVTLLWRARAWFIHDM